MWILKNKNKMKKDSYKEQMGGCQKGVEGRRGGQKRCRF